MLTTMQFNPINFDWNFLFTILNLIVFYIVLKKFLWKPILKVIDKRKEMIDKQFKEADDANQEANALKVKYESKMTTADEEKNALLEDAKINAKAQANKILSDAHDESAKFKKDARSQIELERENAMHKVHDSIASLAMDAAKKVVENAGEIDNSAIYDEFLNENGDE